MPDISTTISLKSDEWLDRIQKKKTFVSRGEAIDFLINQQLKRRGDGWLKEKRPDRAANPQRPTTNSSKNSSKKTMTRKKTAAQKSQSKTTTSETPTGPKLP